MPSSTSTTHTATPVAVAVLFAAHDAEFFRLFGIISLQAVGEIFVDAGVFLFKCDGERKNFLFGEAVEGFHKYGENKRAMASRSFAGKERLSTSAKETSRAVEIFFSMTFSISRANSRP